MVSFSCESCCDVLVKKKLDAHTYRCPGAQFTCLDCSTTFPGFEYRTHTSCISEAQKYQKALYRPGKGAGKKNGNGDSNSTPAAASPAPTAPSPVVPAPTTVTTSTSEAFIHPSRAAQQMPTPPTSSYTSSATPSTSTSTAPGALPFKKQWQHGRGNRRSAKAGDESSSDFNPNLVPTNNNRLEQLRAAAAASEEAERKKNEATSGISTSNGSKKERDVVVGLERKDKDGKESSKKDKKDKKEKKDKETTNGDASSEPKQKKRKRATTPDSPEKKTKNHTQLPSSSSKSKTPAQQFLDKVPTNSSSTKSNTSTSVSKILKKLAKEGVFGELDKKDKEKEKLAMFELLKGMRVRRLESGEVALVVAKEGEEED